MIASVLVSEAVLGTPLRCDSTTVEPRAFSGGGDQEGESQSVPDFSAAFPPNIANSRFEGSEPPLHRLNGCFKT
jgi:hypothetical protein